MEANNTHGSEDLSDFENRLAEWRPSAEGLHPDAMMYAAGVAAGRRDKRSLMWPSVCMGMALFSAASLGWGWVERMEKQVLAKQLQEQSPNRDGLPSTAFAFMPKDTYSPSANDYIHLRRRAEQDPALLVALSQQSSQNPVQPEPSHSDILKAGEVNRFRD